jgi:hypothetical protein
MIANDGSGGQRPGRSLLQSGRSRKMRLQGACYRHRFRRRHLMKQEFTVGMNLNGKSQSVSVQAEDALIAALKVKHERPRAVINYVRKRNKRGDLRHPHLGITPATR